MTAKDVATDRLGAWVAQLNEINALLKEHQSDKALDPYLLDRMDGVFEKEIDELCEKLNRELSLLQNGEVTRGTWIYLQERGRECRALFSDCLSYIQSSGARFGG